MREIEDRKVVQLLNLQRECSFVCVSHLPSAIQKTCSECYSITIPPLLIPRHCYFSHKKHLSILFYLISSEVT